MYGVNTVSLLWEILIIWNFCLNKKSSFCREFKNLCSKLSFLPSKYKNILFKYLKHIFITLEIYGAAYSTLPINFI